MKAALLWEMLRLNNQQHLSTHEHEKLVLAKLRRQARRAWNYSPYFREIFLEADFHPNDLTSLPDLGRLPLLRKSDLLKAGKSAYCTDIYLTDCVWIKSRSDMSHFKIPFTKFDKAHRMLTELRSLMAHGFSYKHVMAIIWNSVIPGRHKLFNKKGILRREYLSAFDDPLLQLVRLNELKPDIIYSYASNLKMLANVIESSPVKERPQPRILMSSGDALDEPSRRLLTHAFGVEPIDFYGAMEFGWIGWQCQERNGYHINSDCLIVECLKDGRPAMLGEEGELVVTNLYSDAAPLIRYVTGDTGVLDTAKCGCGRTLPMLARLNVRSEDRDGCVVAV